MNPVSRSFQSIIVTILLLCGAVLLGLAQQLIVDAAEVQPTALSGDPSSAVGFDPTAGIMDEDGVAPDADPSAEMLSLFPQGDPTGPDDSVNIQADDPFTVPVGVDIAAGLHAYPDPGWPRTTAVITLAAPIANPAAEGKWIDINLTQETVTAYSGTMPLKTVLTSTGTRKHPTVVGTFHVWAKVPSQTMRGGSVRNHDRYYLPGVPNILYFYQGYSLHGAYWHRNFGHPMSHGCANLTLDDSAWFYQWTPLGTTVRVHS